MKNELQNLFSILLLIDEEFLNNYIFIKLNNTILNQKIKLLIQFFY